MDSADILRKLLAEEAGRLRAASGCTPEDVREATAMLAADLSLLTQETERDFLARCRASYRATHTLVFGGSETGGG